VSEVTDIRKPDRICMDCGKTFMEAHSGNCDPDTVNEDEVCPRCSSVNHVEYVEAEHQEIEINVPENYRHEMEDKAREIFNNVSDLTGWRESKVRLWFQLANPLLGEVSPEWMIMNGRSERLEKFIAEARDHRDEYLDEALSNDKTACCSDPKSPTADSRRELDDIADRWNLPDSERVDSS